MLEAIEQARGLLIAADADVRLRAYQQADSREYGCLTQEIAKNLVLARAACADALSHEEGA
jgi:hypothetical protein